MDFKVAGCVDTKAKRVNSTRNVLQSIFTGSLLSNWLCFNEYLRIAYLIIWGLFTSWNGLHNYIERKKGLSYVCCFFGSSKKFGRLSMPISKGAGKVFQFNKTRIIVGDS